MFYTYIFCLILAFCALDGLGLKINAESLRALLATTGVSLKEL
ncbi:hypothetical protein EWM64_g2636 [Hericium alpestre]|nr:hypothetical protein EWM64_g2636 [Hericium alpestre]